MNGQIVKQERIKVGNKIVETTIKELPLYRLCKTQASYWWESGMFDEFLKNKKIVSVSAQYDWLNNTSDFECDSRDIDEVLSKFSKYIKNKYGTDYKVYVVQEYRHSCGCFYLTDTTDRVDSWDSGFVGVMAMPKDVDSRLIANMITDVYEGTVDLYEIIDNETDEAVDEFEYWSNADSINKYHEIADEIKNKYGLELGD